jgi:hypothetical protein
MVGHQPEQVGEHGGAGRIAPSPADRARRSHYQGRLAVANGDHEVLLKYYRRQYSRTGPGGPLLPRVGVISNCHEVS